MLVGIFEETVYGRRSGFLTRDFLDKALMQYIVLQVIQLSVQNSDE